MGRIFGWKLVEVGIDNMTIQADLCSIVVTHIIGANFLSFHVLGLTFFREGATKNGIQQIIVPLQILRNEV